MEEEKGVGEMPKSSQSTVNWLSNRGANQARPSYFEIYRSAVICSGLNKRQTTGAFHNSASAYQLPHIHDRFVWD